MITSHENRELIIIMRLTHQMVSAYLMLFQLISHRVNLRLPKINSTVVKYRSGEILYAISTVIWYGILDNTSSETSNSRSAARSDSKSFSITPAFVVLPVVSQIFRGTQNLANLVFLLNTGLFVSVSVSVYLFAIEKYMKRSKKI